VIPSEAFAKITCRLVPDQSAEDISEKVESFLQAAFPASVKVEVEGKGGGDPYVILPPGKNGSNKSGKPLLDLAFPLAEKCIQKGFGTKPLYLREGGSIPIIRDLKEVTGLDSLMLGLFTNEDNLHAPNESFNLEIMHKSIDAFVEFFLGLEAI